MQVGLLLKIGGPRCVTYFRGPEICDGWGGIKIGPK